MAAFLSIIVPVLNDSAAARQLFGQIPRDPRVELIVVDGGHDLELDGLPGARVLRSAPGRARQMNAGADAASGEWLLFLHADSRLPPDWLGTFVAHAPPADGGWFAFALDDPAWQARVIELGVRWRVRLFRLPYGDQGLFVRRSLFEILGGYRDLPLMEDVEFVRRLVAQGRVVQLPVSLRTSARRWRRDGWLRRSVRNIVLLTLYYLHVPPARLARWYG